MMRLHCAVWQQLNNVSEGSRSVSTKLHGVTTQKAAITSNLPHLNYLHVSTSAVPKQMTSRLSLSQRNTKNIDFCSISLTRDNTSNRKWVVISLFYPTNSVCHFLSIFRSAYGRLASRQEVINDNYQIKQLPRVMHPVR